jgi:hypothetical protein
MKKLLFILSLSLWIMDGLSQENKSRVLQDLEKDRTIIQNNDLTATVKSATRLFKDKTDLTSVILVIPVDSTVNVLGSDDTFMYVSYNGIEGYIYSRHAEVNRNVAVTKPASGTEEQVIDQDQSAQTERPVQQRQRMSRYEYLVSKYGELMAAKLYEGKIWKGMPGQMIRDSWGSPKKINRVISDNNIREEWIYQKTWLYLQNDELVQWGPTK